MLNSNRSSRRVNFQVTQSPDLLQRVFSNIVGGVLGNCILGIQYLYGYLGYMRLLRLLLKDKKS